jgi:hypothetical protein
VSRDLEGEVIILHLGAGTYFGLDGVGARVWELLREPRSFAAVLDAVTAEFEVERPRCEEDLRRLLEQMVERGLVEVKGGAG